jgi:O-acetyl-ADP-ribose deacetylase (regulator of RNase III)
MNAYTTVWHQGLEYRVGDITRAPEQIIAHGCNAQGRFGRGVAAAIRSRWPDAAEIYKAEFEHANNISTGSVIWALPRPDDDRPIIAHMITQAFYGADGRRYVSYDAIDVCLRKVASRALNELQIEEVAIPLVGAGLGGGRWGVVREIISGVLADWDIRFVMYHNSEDQLKSIIDPT